MGQRKVRVSGQHGGWHGDGSIPVEGLGGMRLGERACAAVTATVLAVTVLSACTDSGPTPSPTPAPTTSAPSEEPPPTAEPTSDADVAASAAETALRDYLDLSNDLRIDAGLSLDELESLATGIELDSQTAFLTDWREKGWQATGEARLVEVDVVDVSLDNSAPDSGRVPTVTVEVCADVAGTDVVDASGDSVVAPDRADRGWTRYLVSNYAWDADPSGGWRVASSETLEREPCDAD